jgi:Domain of unknown function (DUF4384)
MLKLLLSKLMVIVALLLPSSVALCQKQDPAQDEPSSRQIVLDRFNKARPAEPTAKASARVQTRVALKAAVYRRTGRIPRVPARTSFEEIGVTVWRLRPSRSSDEGARVLVMDGLRQSEWTPERIEADTPLKIGDRVRLSVESPRQGFLYIVDREQYADGSFGEPMLIFPTLRTRGGDNRVEPGRLIDIPAQEDQFSYFTAQPAGDRRDQVAEVLTIILVPQPLPLQLAAQPLKMGDAQVNEWERLWGGAAERLELVDGAGQPWTMAEKAAGAAMGRQLTQTGPPPQTVYRVARKAGGPLLVTVPLRYSR